MNEAINNRIEQVRCGEVPEGYKRTRAGLTPDSWIREGEIKASALFKNHSNKAHGGAFEVLSATQEKGIIPRSEVEIDIKYDADNLSSYKKVDVGDFVISLRSFQGGIEFSPYEGLVSPAYTVIKAKRPICEEFYKPYFKTIDFISRLNCTIYGIRDGKQIGFEDFGNLAIHYPPLPEQRKIAEILTCCDQVITLKKQLLDEKRRQKKWLMQKLLVLDSGVRMPGFSSGWERYELCNCFTYIRNGFVGISTIHYRDTGVIYLEGKNIKDGKWDLSSLTYVTEEFNRTHPNSILRENDVVVVQSGHTGDCAVVTNHIAGSNCHAIIIMTPITSKINPYYCAYYINSEFGKKALLGATTGNTVKHILASDMKKYSFLAPEINEQDSIVSLLSAADREINLLDQEILEWQQKKKSLMQLLLTGIVRVNV